MGMTYAIPPCKECKDKRFFGCHDSCELYKQWKTHRDEVDKAMQNERNSFLNPRRGY